MTGIINFFRGDVSPMIMGKLFYFGGEPIDTSAEGNDLQGLYHHFLKCSDPDVSPESCQECSHTELTNYVLHDQKRRERCVNRTLST